MKCSTKRNPCNLNKTLTYSEEAVLKQTNNTNNAPCLSTQTPFHSLFVFPDEPRSAQSDGNSSRKIVQLAKIECSAGSFYLIKTPAAPHYTYIAKFLYIRRDEQTSEKRTAFHTNARKYMKCDKGPLKSPERICNFVYVVSLTTNLVQSRSNIYSFFMYLIN